MDNILIGQFQEIKKLIEESKNILIVSHEDPDADAVGSALALHCAFSAKNLKSFCHLPDPAPLSFKFLPRFFEIGKIPEPADLVFCLDYGDKKRLKLADSFFNKKVVTIDHHRGNQCGNVQIVRPEISSTSEIVYYFLKETGFNIDKEVATCLLTGIAADTGIFSHISTSSNTMKAVSELLLKGAPLSKILGKALSLKSRFLAINTKMWGRALSEVKFDDEKLLAYSYFTYEDLKEYPVSSLDFAGIASTISTIIPSCMSLFLVEYEKGKIRGSLRSEAISGKRVDDIAKALGGGGHLHAAGFKCQGTVEEALERVQQLIA